MDAREGELAADAQREFARIAKLVRDGDAEIDALENARRWLERPPELLPDEERSRLPHLLEEVMDQLERREADRIRWLAEKLKEAGRKQALRELAEYLARLAQS